MAAFKSVSVMRQGRTYNGSWHLDRTTVVVSNAYGSTSRGEVNEDTAEAILAELVELWTP